MNPEVLAKSQKLTSALDAGDPTVRLREIYILIGDPAAGKKIGSIEAQHVKFKVLRGDDWIETEALPVLRDDVIAAGGEIGKSDLGKLLKVLKLSVASSKTERAAELEAHKAEANQRHQGEREEVDRKHKDELTELQTKHSERVDELQRTIDTLTLERDEAIFLVGGTEAGKRLKLEQRLKDLADQAERIAEERLALQQEQTVMNESTM